MINYEEQLEKLLQEYKLHEVLESHLKQFKSKSVDDITKLPLDEVPSVEGVITKQENIDRHPPLERILLLGNEIEKERTKEQREKLVRERAEAVFKSGDKEKIQDIASIVSGDKEAPIYSDKEAFISDCIEVSGTISYYILGILSKETVDYLNRETVNISDEELLKMFDLSINGSYCWLDSRRYNILVSLYIARQSAGLKEGIIRMFKENILHDLKSRYSFGTKDYEKAYKEYSVDDDTLTMLAEAKLYEHISYNVFDDYLDKVKSILGKKPKNKIIQGTYGGYLTKSCNPLNNSFMQRGLIPTGESVPVKKSKTSKLIECKYMLNIDSISINPDYSNDSRRIEEDLSNILEEYKDFIVDNKTFPVQVIQAIGSILRVADPSFDSESISNGKIATIRAVDITTDMIKKYMYADKKARATDKFDRDVGRVIELLKKLQITITDTSKGDLRIAKENLITCSPLEIYKKHGIEKGWRFSLMPPTELYATCNNQLYTIPFIKTEIRNSTSHSSLVKDIVSSLEGYIKKYHHRNNYELKLSYEKIIENAFGRESPTYFDVINTSPEKRALNKRSNIYRAIDRAIEILDIFLRDVYEQEENKEEVKTEPVKEEKTETENKKKERKRDTKIEIKEIKKGRRTYKTLYIYWIKIKEEQQDKKENPKRTKKA